MRRFSTRVILWAVLASGAGFLGACSEAMETEELQAQSINQGCEVPEGHDSCRTINGEELLTTDAPEAPWRINHGYSENDGHQVTFMAEALNGGLVPMVENQGHYDSEEDFRARLSQLLGADLDETSFAQITQVGSTLKMSGDPDTEGFGASTTGILLIDALSDEQGRIFIDGEEFNLAEGQLIDFDYDASFDASEGLLTNQSSLKIKAGPDEANYNLIDTNILWTYQSLGSQLSNYKKNGNGSYHKWAPKRGLKWGWFPYWIPWWEKVTVGTTMRITNNYYIKRSDLPTNYPFFTNVHRARTGDAYQTNVDHLSEFLIWFGFGVKAGAHTYPTAVFKDRYIDQVCGNGTAGGASGSVGTFDYCDSAFSNDF